MTQVVERKLPIIEIFGPTLQGEGALIGSQTHFIRLGGCDYACTWCDTKEAVIPELVRQNATPMRVDDIICAIADLNGSPEWMTISGGNPLLFNLTDLVARLQSYGFKVAVETQGSIYKPWVGHVDLLTISPKAPSSGMSEKTDLDVIRHLASSARRAVLKIPVAGPEDLKWAKGIFKQLRWVQGYIQPVKLPEHGVVQQLAALERMTAQVMADKELGKIIILPQLHQLMGLK